MGWVRRARCLSRWEGQRSGSDPSPAPGMDNRCPGVAPDQARVRRRRLAARQSLHPLSGRPGKPSREHFRISGHKGAIPLRRSDDPDAGHEVRSLAADRDRQIARCRELPIKRASACSDVSERVPRLFDQQPSTEVVADEHIDRSRRIVRSNRKLERPPAAGRPGQAQQQLLDREVTGIDGSLLPIASQGERRAKTEGMGERKPGLDADALANPELDPADLALADPDHSAELGLRQSTADPSRPDRSAKVPENLVCLPIQLELPGRSTDSAGHGTHDAILAPDDHRGLIPTLPGAASAEGAAEFDAPASTR
jgi:hypothetical protein